MKILIIFGVALIIVISCLALIKHEVYKEVKMKELMEEDDEEVL